MMRAGAFAPRVEAQAAISAARTIEMSVRITTDVEVIRDGEGAVHSQQETRLGKAPVAVFVWTPFQVAPSFENGSRELSWCHSYSALAAIRKASSRPNT